MRANKSIHLFFGGLLLFCIVAVLMMGETPWSTVWQNMQQRLLGNSREWNPLLDERLPRLIVLLCTGASLAVSGAVMQSIFQNPLASPSVLGISSGGSLMVLLVFMSGWSAAYPILIPFNAVLGSFATLLGVYYLARRNGVVPLNSLILTGIAITTVLFAIHSAILYSLRDNWQLVRTITEWEAGTTEDRGWQHVHMQLPLTLIGLWGCWHYREEINILALGDEDALNLGCEVETVRWRLFLCIALLTGGALASMGMIAFFGLVLPHVIRNLAGPDNRRLVPLCLLGGAAVLACLDIFLRFFNINNFTIGNISAIIGGFFFLTLLFRMEKGGRSCQNPA
jgi:iron complex transport system permease protein